MNRLLFSSFAVVLLVVAWWLGGWPWALLWALSFLLLARQETPAIALAAAGPAFIWLVLFHQTGDRRLFFPFAVQVGQASSPVVVLAAFFAIRIQQSATPHVLVIEFLVTAAVLTVGNVIQRHGTPGLQTRILAAASASILALIGLLV